MKSLRINDIIIIADDLPECFSIESSSICVVKVPQEYQLDELDIVATNNWNGKTYATLPSIDESTLNPQPPDPEHLIFDGLLEPWIILVLVFALMILAIYFIVKKYWEKMISTAKIQFDV